MSINIYILSEKVLQEIKCTVKGPERRSRCKQTNNEKHNLYLSKMHTTAMETLRR